MTFGIFQSTGRRADTAFDPDQCGNPPKKAVKEIDASSKVKGNVTVIPENLSENNFCKYAADIFIGTAQKGTDEENMSVRLILVFVEQNSCKDDGEAPDDAEGPPDQAAAVHPFAGGKAAENGFGNVSQQ